MNMISTGAFLNEMDASNKQHTVAEKFAAVWEKKNAKAARAGGVSLMALSLAACGGSSSTTTTSTDTSTSTDTTTTTTPTGSAFTLTAAAAGDDLVGTDGADTFTAATTARFQSADAINGGAGSDTLTAQLNSATAHTGSSVINVETLNFTLHANSTLNGSTISGATAVNVDGGFALTYSAHDGEVFSLSGKSTGLTTDLSADAATGDAITLNLNGSAALGTVTIGTEGATEYETITLNAGGATKVTLADAGTADYTDADESIVITGASDLTVAIAAAGLGEATTDAAKDAKIDGSAHTGALTLDMGTASDETASFNDLKLVTGVDTVRIGTADTSGNETTTLAGLNGVSKVHLDGFGDATDDVTLALKTATASDDAIEIYLDSETNDTAVDGGNLTVTGIEKVTVTSSGQESATATSNVANVIDALVTTTAASSLTVGGDRKLTVDSVDADFITVNVTNTVGSDLTVAAGGNLAYTGGSGKDRLELDTVADVTANDSLNGGDGADTLAVSATAGTDFSAAQRAVISNFETLEYVGAQDVSAASGVTIDLTKITGMNALKMASDVTTANSNTLTVNAESGFTFTALGVNDSNSASTNLIFSIKNAADAGTNDTVNYNIMNVDGNDDASQGFTIDNVENLVISMTGDGDADGEDTVTIADIDGAQLTSLTVTSTNTGVDAAGTLDGSDDLIITAVETTILATLDASGMTGDFTMVDTSAFSGSGANVKGGSAVDTISTGSGADVITGGKGADVLKGGGGNDNIDGGAGDDSIHGEAGADKMTGGTGDNTFVFADDTSTEAATDVIKDFTAGAADADFDTLDVVGATVSKAEASAVDVKAGTADTDTSVTATVANGIITLGGTEKANVNTLAEWIDVAEILLARNVVDDNDTEAGVIAFEFDGSTYVVAGDDGTSEATYATELVIQLEGVTGITAISTTEAANTIHIA